MTFLDWLLDWRALVALAAGDAALMAMFLLWDARHLASLTFTVLEQQRLSPEDRGATLRGLPGSGT
ncbi:hypothetical protein [Variovorax paradoxus]|uniref:hypothetical protein n=1 Tax=Variovorax paradoxus TaxID=34073 RepID=UPI0012DA4CDB|nr:hypothetical protein [Variovorax paradoxus]